MKVFLQIKNRFAKYAVLAVVTLGGASHASHAQKYSLMEADKFYQNYHYASAIPLYESWLKTHPADVEVKKKLANSYVKLNDSGKGEQLYADIVNSGAAENNIILTYAEMLAMNGKYSSAKSMYELYRQRGGDARGERFAQGLSNLDDFYRDSLDVRIEFLPINSSQEDFGPAFYKKGLVFCSAQVPHHGLKHTFNWNHGAYLDLYMIDDTAAVHANYYTTKLSDKKKEKHVRKDVHSDHTFHTSNDSRTLGYYSKAVYDDTLKRNFPGLRQFDETLNTRYHEGPLVFFNGEDSLIFTRNNYIKGKYETDKEGTNRLKMFVAARKGEEWKEKNFPYNSDEYSVGHPALAPDNKTLYFSSDMPGGKGGTDIWFCQLINSEWTRPVNLADVNTEGQEMFPFVDQHGNLYFASNGWAGLGGLDIFYSEKTNDKFGEPVNVGYPINSMKDDFGLILTRDDRTGYFASARRMEKSGDDIYFFKSKNTLVRNYSITGFAMNEKTSEVLENATIVLSDDKGVEINRITTSSDGSYSFEVEQGRRYTLKAEKEEFLPFVSELSTETIRPGQPARHDALLKEKGTYALACVITDRNTGTALDSVVIKLIDLSGNKEIFAQNHPGKGEFFLAMKEAKKGDACNLMMQVTRKGYLSKAVSYHEFFKEPGVLNLHEVMDLKMDKIDLGTDIGKLVKVNPIYFDLGKSVIRKDAAIELDKIVAVMNENPGMKIELGSHTDARGSDASNLSLSDKRAKASAAYIVSKGISADRITGKGYGESKLSNACSDGVKCSEAEHQLNRRTEFLVVSIE